MLRNDFVVTQSDTCKARPLWRRVSMDHLNQIEEGELDHVARVVVFLFV